MWHCNATESRCWARLYTMNSGTQRFIVDWPRLPIIKNWNVTVSNKTMLNVEISTTFGWEITGTSSFSRSFFIQSRYWIITTWISLIHCKRVQKLEKYILKSSWAAWFQREKRTIFSFDILGNGHWFTSHHKL